MFEVGDELKRFLLLDRREGRRRKRRAAPRCLTLHAAADDAGAQLTATRIRSGLLLDPGCGDGRMSRQLSKRWPLRARHHERHRHRRYGRDTEDSWRAWKGQARHVLRVEHPVLFSHIIPWRAIEAGIPARVPGCGSRFWSRPKTAK